MAGAGKKGERTASSATRFTATTPHASSKKASAAVAPSVPRFPPRPAAAPASPRSPPTPAAASAPGPGPAPRSAPQSAPKPAVGPAGGYETPEQRIARLRAAHDAAKNARVSRFDQFLAKARPFFDSAHRLTVLSMVGLTAVVTVVTAYTAYDMLQHNRRRKVDFAEAQVNLAPDSIEAARLAYMRGDATEEQIAMVEKATADGAGFKLPSILSAPKPLGNRRGDEGEGASTDAPTDGTAPETTSSKLWGLFGSKSTSKGAVAGPAAPEQPPKSLEEKRAMLETARAAFDKERENQSLGGPLDRLGTEQSEPNWSQPKQGGLAKRKGWWW